MLKLIDAVTSVLTYVASAAVFGLMAVVTADVVFRNLGVFYFQGVMDYVSILLILVAGFSIPVAFVKDRHLVVEMGTYGLSPSAKSRLEAIWLIVAVPVLAMLAWLVLHEGFTTAKRGKVLGVMGWSPVTFHGLVAFALAASALACLVVGVGKMMRRPVTEARVSEHGHGEGV